MRPVRVTGVTGTSTVIPLDVYCISPALISLETTGSGAQLQFTIDDVFNAGITPTWTNAGAVSAGANIVSATPSGARGVRCTGMVPADVLVVSQQSIT